MGQPVFYVRRKITTRYAGEPEKVLLMRRKRKPPMIEWQQVRQPLQTKSMEVIQMDNNSLAHTKWNCKYHIVFTPKYRRQIIYKQISADIGQIIRTLCARKGIEIIEAAALPDHIHLYVTIPPKYSVSEIVGYLKGKSSLMIFDRHANLKYKYGNRHFWCRGYYVDTVGRNEKTIKEYVRNQLQEDIASDQMCLKEFKDPFTGEPVAKGK